MSYLDSPRLHFRGWFQADVSTINNRVEPFKNDSFVPQYQKLNVNGSWNPEGTGIFRFIDCSVTGGFIDGRQLVSADDDPVIGLSLQNADRRTPGKLVDLDPQQQMVSEIWGMQTRLAGPGTDSLMQGEYKPAAFINLWKRQLKAAMPRDQTLAAYYQSVLEGVEWHAATGSPLLEALKAATHDDMLSIEFNLFGYGRDSNIPRYTLGHIVGTIGPYRRGEPKHFVLGRQLVADTSNFPLTAQGVGSAQAKVSDDGVWLTVDFGNSFPIEEANSGLHDIGPVSVGVLNSSPSTLQNTVDASQVTMIGAVPYLEPDWYTRTAGVQSFDLSSNPTARCVLRTCPLVILTPVADTTTYKVLVQESIEGLYVRADQFVFRMEPGQTQQVEFYVSRFGAPLGGAAVTVTATSGLMGGPGGSGSIEPPPDPPAPIPTICTPADALTYAASVTTDDNGKATLPIVASASGPGTPRGYLSGQLYGLAYQLTSQPPGYVGNMLNYISVLAYSAKAVSAEPTWYADIEPIFTQYAHLYPIMSHHVVDLADYDSVVQRLAILKLAFALPERDPNHMPVTRDLGGADRETILKWLDSKGPNGLPPLGVKPAVSPLPAAVPATLKTAPSATAGTAAASLESVEGASKTSFINDYLRRRAEGRQA